MNCIEFCNCLKTTFWLHFLMLRVLCAQFSSDPKMASAHLDGRTLHLTVRLQTGPKEDEEEPAEEIGGLINSNGEEVTWDGSKLICKFATYVAPSLIRM